uniref:AP2/ERF domain-containing protein n=1 Tax=Chromera velia CCMP2878 TaxID=1169474 RepID=A0A0G4HW00_9ALVE|eukprot:Cvel_8958.t1-p1 / transcript=Cvel_8958.t1 / gene=Cvel_8958 / organism=Chromera_velia_CCMP2878 / gene_product=hypothetical protein / transcript_product=hypothetical protein / location=Cvel_scaffold505:14755-18729(-) / protein_length=1191 / sequence_SO=supercontig / SO=protein_coding / is_pseudo=false
MQPHTIGASGLTKVGFGRMEVNESGGKFDRERGSEIGANHSEKGLPEGGSETLGVNDCCVSGSRSDFPLGDGPVPEKGIMPGPLSPVASFTLPTSPSGGGEYGHNSTAPPSCLLSPPESPSSFVSCLQGGKRKREGGQTETPEETDDIQEEDLGEAERKGDNDCQTSGVSGAGGGTLQEAGFSSKQTGAYIGNPGCGSEEGKGNGGQDKGMVPSGGGGKIKEEGGGRKRAKKQQQESQGAAGRDGKRSSRREGVSWDQKHSSWVAKVRVDGRVSLEKFPVSVYGEAGALQAAIAYRQVMVGGDLGVQGGGGETENGSFGDVLGEGVEGRFDTLGSPRWRRGVGEGEEVEDGRGVSSLQTEVESETGKKGRMEGEEEKGGKQGKVQATSEKHIQKKALLDASALSIFVSGGKVEKVKQEEGERKKVRRPSDRLPRELISIIDSTSRSDRLALLKDKHVSQSTKHSSSVSTSKPLSAAPSQQKQKKTGGAPSGRLPREVIDSSTHAQRKAQTDQKASAVTPPHMAETAPSLDRDRGKSFPKGGKADVHPPACSTAADSAGGLSGPKHENHLIGAGCAVTGDGKRCSRPEGVSWDQRHSSWVAKVRVDGRVSLEKFPVSVYGEAGALEAAIAYRQVMIGEKGKMHSSSSCSRMGSDDDEGGASVSAECDKREGGLEEGERARGVHWDSVNGSWTAAIGVLGGQPRLAFSVKVYGKRGALQKAKECRAEMEKMKEEGYGSLVAFRCEIRRRFPQVLGGPEGRLRGVIREEEGRVSERERRREEDGEDTSPSADTDRRSFLEFEEVKGEVEPERKQGGTSNTPLSALARGMKEKVERGGKRRKKTHPPPPEGPKPWTLPRDLVSLFPLNSLSNSHEENKMISYREGKRGAPVFTSEGITSSSSHPQTDDTKEEEKPERENGNERSGGKESNNEKEEEGTEGEEAKADEGQQKNKKSTRLKKELAFLLSNHLQYDCPDRNTGGAEGDGSVEGASSLGLGRGSRGERRRLVALHQAKLKRDGAGGGEGSDDPSAGETWPLSSPVSSFSRRSARLMVNRKEERGDGLRKEEKEEGRLVWAEHPRDDQKEEDDKHNQTQKRVSRAGNRQPSGALAVSLRGRRAEEQPPPVSSFSLFSSGGGSRKSSSALSMSLRVRVGGQMGGQFVSAVGGRRRQQKGREEEEEEASQMSGEDEEDKNKE